ncbi:MAG TPA: hypothetical protein DEP18_06555 [Flavobacteriales bacterium]|jgi:hypothetical protein|nr:hypothetical protein [Flavobacteriales bacterium]HCA83430.1 hypothetical protein [Flavobacteriales bacterium]HRE73657.1 hypothetical protein [Flavobacteriales bacterium]HRE95281.1 hypothetical protein [Flavobacteriales bacterium]HRJ35352.1 hypothetical protein [Flavobacteriales bacterium]
MLGQLELIAESEYNNAGDLLGIDPMNVNGELLGALKAMNPIARQKVINAIAKNPAPSKGSRAEMEKHFRELQPHIKEELTKGNLRLADTLIYSIKAVNSKTVKIFETQTDKEIGLTNISNAKLPKNMSMLVSGIILLVGTAAGATKDDSMATNFGKIEAFPAIANGEFSLKANKKTIVPEIGNYVFKTENNHLLTLGYFKLANPRLIQDDVQIEMTIELGTVTGIPANTYVYAALHGTATIP